MAADPTQPTSIKLVSHSMLFYWWPIWACGLILGLLSLLSGYRLAVLPEGTRLEARTQKAQSTTYLLVLPGNREATLPLTVKGQDGESFPVRVSADPSYGMVFCVVLLLVIFSTTIPLRGLWSLVVFLGFLLVSLLFAWLGLWGTILGHLGHMHLYLSAPALLFPSIVLFLVWVATVFLFDRKRYIIFTPGQLVVHREVGDMQQVYDTTNVIVEKRRSDFFRHVLLGFMSGDLVIQVGQGGQQLELPNVLFAAWKVKQVANLMKTRPVVPAGV
jgi:hypothetical protein